jgi:hypothetical protein
MNRDEYLKAVNQFLYQGEVLGEALLNCYVSLETDPIRKYKWATVMQLESETKVRRRPFHDATRPSIAQDDPRKNLAELTKGFSSKSWQRHMEEIVQITTFDLDKFREVEAAAPESEREREVAHSMVVHETSIKRFAELELAGDDRNSLNDVIAQLKFPLAAPK